MNGTWSLAVELDITTTPPSVADVCVMIFNGHHTYGIRRDIEGTITRGPYAVLAEVSCRSPHEASQAIKGLIESDPDLEWVRDYPGLTRFLHPWPDLRAGRKAREAASQAEASE